MKQFALILATCAVAIWALPHHQATKGVPFNTIDGRIINGDEAAPGQFPWQVAVYLKTINETHFCGGSLIGDEWVLTAGHCVDGFTSWTILLGTNRLQDNNSVSIDTNEAFTHENFSLNFILNDIALIHLPQKVNFTDNIQPIALGEDEIGEGVEITVSGWGKTSDDSNTTSPVLNYVSLTTISNAECSETYGDLIVDNIVCANSNTNGTVHSTCNGDSGGPVVINSVNATVHVALVSFGSSLGCESGYPVGFTRTAYYRDWIREKTGI